MNEQLIKFIELCLIDGIITDKEREIIFRKSKEFGVPDDECEVILEGMIHQKGMVSENFSKDSSTSNTSVKPQKSNSFKPKKVTKSVLIDLNNSENLLEEKEKLKIKNNKLTNDNKLLKKEISDNIVIIEDNSLIYLNSLKVNDRVFGGYVVSDVIEDLDEIDLYKKEEGTVTWGLENSTKKEPVLPHPFFVIYNYVETSVNKRYDITYGKNKDKYVEQGGILQNKTFSFENIFLFNEGNERQSIIPLKYKGMKPLKVIILETKMTRLVVFIFNDDFMVIELKYSTSFEISDLKIINNVITYDHPTNKTYWYSITRVEHIIHENLLKILNI